jgi:hypothetical protein
VGCGFPRGFRQRFGSQADASDAKKTVDEMQKVLHNLVSLLLTQQRKTGGTEKRLFRCCRRLSDAIFKNLQPISVGA